MNVFSEEDLIQLHSRAENQCDYEEKPNLDGNMHRNELEELIANQDKSVTGWLKNLEQVHSDADSISQKSTLFEPRSENCKIFQENVELPCKKIHSEIS